MNLYTVLNKLNISYEEVEHEPVITVEQAQGSVTPFEIINDVDNKVLLVIDSSLKDKKLLFHPNVNNKTTSIKYDDLIKFIEFEKHSYILI